MEIRVVLSADDKLLKAVTTLSSALTLVGGAVSNPLIDKTESVPAKSESTKKETPKQQEEPEKSETSKGEAESTKSTENASEITKKEDHGITFEMLRAEAGKMLKAKKQATLKAILSEFGTDKLSGVDKADYPALFERIKTELGES